MPRAALPALGLLLAPAQSWACSGPGAMEYILRSERQGLLLFAGTLVFAIGLTLVPRLRARGLRKLWPFALLVVIHPGWWMSARSGDCGRTLVEGSVLITAVALVLGAIAIVRAKPGRSLPAS